MASRVGAPTASSTSAKSTRLNILDCHSIFEIVETIRQYRSLTPGDQAGPPPNFDYRECFTLLEKWRKDNGFEPSQKSLALATVDFESDGQARFITAISRLVDFVEPVDFRDANVTLPVAGDGDKTERRYVTTLAPNICYALGLLAGRAEVANVTPEVIIVTRAFELFGSLTDFAKERNGKAAIAFFRRFLDPRFGIAGLFEADSPVKFIDLDPHSEKLVGSDIRQMGLGLRARTKGISGL